MSNGVPDNGGGATGAINLARVLPFQLGAMEVLPATRQLKRGGRNETVEPRVMQVLVALWRANGAVVSRDDLIASCWDGRVVGDNAIHRTISRLRDISSTIGEGCLRLETVSKVGYRLIALDVAAEVDKADTPLPLATAGKKSSRATIAAAVVLGVAAISVGLTIWTRAPAASPVTIAVAGRGGDSADLARGLAADLARFANVRSAIAFSEASNAGRSDYTLTVNERRAGNRMQVDVALLRNSSPDVLWSASFAGAANLRERAAAAVSKVAECALDANSDPLPPGGGDELRLIFSACDRLDYDADDVPNDIAVSTWRRIVARDPENARALATLAYVEAWRSTDYDSDPSIAAALRAAARAHLSKARALNAQLGLTYVAEALLIPDSRHGDKLATVKRGIASDPDCAALHAVESDAYLRVGFMNDAVASVRKAAEIDPGHASWRTGLALALAFNGLTNEARSEFTAAEKVWPGSPALKDAQDRFDYRYGDAAGLIRKIDRGIEVPNSDPVFAQGIQRSFLLARLQPTPVNIEAAADIALKNNGSPGVVQNLVALGRIDRAYELLDDPRAFALVRENTDVLFRSFMRPFLFDRRFMPLAGKLGLVRFWISKDMWPSFCYDKDIPYDCKTEARRLHAQKTI